MTIRARRQRCLILSMILGSALWAVIGGIVL